MQLLCFTLAQDLWVDSSCLANVLQMSLAGLVSNLQLVRQRGHIVLPTSHFLLLRFEITHYASYQMRSTLRLETTMWVLSDLIG
jgi:hypothetical protein